MSAFVILALIYLSGCAGLSVFYGDETPCSNTDNTKYVVAFSTFTMGPDSRVRVEVKSSTAKWVHFDYVDRSPKACTFDTDKSSGVLSIVVKDRMAFPIKLLFAPRSGKFTDKSER